MVLSRVVNIWAFPFVGRAKTPFTNTFQELNPYFVIYFLFLFYFFVNTEFKIHKLYWQKQNIIYLIVFTPKIVHLSKDLVSLINVTSLPVSHGAPAATPRFLLLLTFSHKSKCLWYLFLLVHGWYCNSWTIHETTGTKSTVSTCKVLLANFSD